MFNIKTLARRKRRKYGSSDSDSSDSDSSSLEKYGSGTTRHIAINTKNMTYIGSALNQEKNLLLVYGMEKPRRTSGSSLRRYFILFTLEGNLVTMCHNKDRIDFRSHVSIHFASDCILILSSGDIQFNYIFGYTDYINNASKIEGRLFDCHKSGDIYIPLLDSISVYSQDLEFKDYFQLTTSNTESGSIVALTIEDDVLFVVVKYCEKSIIDSPKCKLYRYCLKTGELLQMYSLEDRFCYRKIANVCSTDRFTNVILHCDESRGYCVWSRDGRVSYCRPSGRTSCIKIPDDSFSCSFTDAFQLIIVRFCIVSIHIM